MKKTTLTIFTLLLFSLSAHSQIINGTDTLYGNEWINFDQDYFKVMVAEDGIYSLPYQQLIDAGMPLNQINGTDFQLFHNGEEVPIYTTSDGTFNANDRIEFFGKKNASELDRYMFQDPDAEMMNPRYSLFTDTSAYFLTWNNSGNALRYQPIANDLSNLPPKEEYYMAEEALVFSDQFNKDGNSEGVRLSNMTVGEGYSSGLNPLQTHTVTPTSAYIGGVEANLYIRYSGGFGSHETAISLNENELATDAYIGFEVREANFSIGNSDLGNPMEIKFQGLLSNSDRNRVANIILNYPRQFDASGNPSLNFILNAAGNKRYIEVNNFQISGNPVYVYDIKNGERLEANINGDIVQIALPGNSSERNLWMANAGNGVKSVASISPVNFIDYENITADFIFLTNPKLYDDGNGNNRVQEYIDYRTSNSGGGYTPILVDIQQVYDQFGWGINRHSLSIRNFGHYVKKNWEEAKYFFIVGKGREYPDIRGEGSLSNPTHASFYVPTYGTPGSDNLLLAGSDGYTPVIPIGRIAVSTPNDLKIYLDKVKDYEANRDLPQTIGERAWMKNILHMGGGQTNGEQSSIRYNLNSLEDVIEANRFGGEVTSFYKTSSDPIQVSQTDQIFSTINNGVSIITFFGHSAVNTFDFSIDNPDNYENYKKYPLIMSLGCYSGNIHTSSPGLSERFNFFKDKGSIAFIATAGQGYITSLYNFATKVYGRIGGENYGMGIGEVLQGAVSDFGPNDFGVNLIRQQFNLNSDPSIALNPAPGPDLVVDEGSVSFSPKQLTAQLDEIELAFDIVNLGEHKEDSILLEISQELPDGSVVSLAEQRVPTPPNRTSFIYPLPSFGKEAVGFNRFFIKIDTDDQVKEKPLPIAESNNELSISGQPGIVVYITDNSAVPIVPPQFGIVNNSDITLMATTSDLLAVEQEYIIEIDTTENFNSSLKKNTSIVQRGGIIRWKPEIIWETNRVYYWRISPVDGAQNFIWENSSFIYLPNALSEGWNQSHFFQWKKDEFEDMELLQPGNLKYIDDVKDIFVKNAVGSIERPEFFINNALSGRYRNTPDGGIYAVVLDSISVTPWVNHPPGQGPNVYGVPHPQGYHSRFFLFSTENPDFRFQLIDFLENVVPEKNYVFLFTVQKNLDDSYFPEQWESDQALFSTDLFQILESQGATQIRNTLTIGAVPYVFAYQKNVGPIYEDLAEDISEIILANFPLPGYWDRGAVTSTPIGPAKEWTSLDWEVGTGFDPMTDTVSVDILGANLLTFNDTVLMENLMPGSIDLSNISATEFPFLKLKFNSEDSLFRSSAQPEYWRIYYQGLPDFALDPAAYFSLESDTIPQGKNIVMQCLATNLGSDATDSLDAHFTLRSLNNDEVLIEKTLAKLATDDTVLAQLNYDSRLLSGAYAIDLELNPDKNILESTRLNNYLATSFFVDRDDENPLLDVTFDGVHILDGELVSAEPLIHISMEDENEFLLLDDTSHLRIFILRPDSVSTLERIYFDNPILTLYPANGTDRNKSNVELRPQFTESGVYKLIIQGQDVTGNAIGANDYSISFEVITESTISNLVNYPNPFTTSTRFVYTMTGNAPPSKYKLQIMTISGKIIREVNQLELGPLKVGTHQTDFAWDGRDQYGDQLAKGIYLFRFVVEDENGEPWEFMETGADKFLKNGIGKMVLLK